ncbi:MAG TPA: glycosyltransferase family 4 protein [Solirubrobacteraceae bacterium]|jgi:glycosyltransferase involved in cell wall biosynthesis|nr:glycosyltransferase family 4 protein [Solirubrobacteraceae bacterium]
MPSPPSPTRDSEGEDRASLGGRERRLLVVSHPSVVSVNQEVYRELKRRGWIVVLVLPRRWRSEYSGRDVEPQALEGMRDALRPTPVLLRGRPQRHVYLTACRRAIARARPDVAFVEAEPFALAATQWGRALKRLGIPFGVQCAENIDRRLPPPVRAMRARTLADAAFVAARSDSAARLARAWGAAGSVVLAPHAVPEWQVLPRPSKRPFTVGYAGRLVESKGLLDLLAAVRALPAPVELLLIGDGELRPRLEGQPIPGSSVRVLDGLSHAEMARGYALCDVIALPSHTTPTWKEQFGRVIVEALWCGVPVVGSDSGEIPWLIELTGGGLIFREGDHEMLAERLSTLRDAPDMRAQLAASGRAAVEARFSVAAATDPLERLLIEARETRHTIASRSPVG